MFHYSLTWLVNIWLFFGWLSFFPYFILLLWCSSSLVDFRVVNESFFYLITLRAASFHKRFHCLVHDLRLIRGLLSTNRLLRISWCQHWSHVRIWRIQISFWRLASRVIKTFFYFNAWVYRIPTFAFWLRPLFKRRLINIVTVFIRMLNRWIRLLRNIIEIYLLSTLCSFLLSLLKL